MFFFRPFRANWSLSLIPGAMPPAIRFRPSGPVNGYGILEYWNIKNLVFSTIPSFRFCSFPSFHYSNIPLISLSWFLLISAFRQIHDVAPFYPLLPPVSGNPTKTPYNSTSYKRREQSFFFIRKGTLWCGFC